MVEWVDSVRDDNGWSEIAVHLPAASYARTRVQTVGLLTASNDEAVLVFQNMQRELWKEELLVSDAMLIPRRSIDRIVYLGPVDE